MVIDQAEMDALLAQAQESPGAAAPEAAAEATSAAQPAQSAGGSSFVAVRRSAGALVSASASATIAPPAADVARILKVRLPVIVRLAQRLLPIGTIRNLSNGAILEFEKSVDDDLELMINNRVIGRGAAVKVGENFGLYISSIGDAAQRIRSMGR